MSDIFNLKDVTLMYYMKELTNQSSKRNNGSASKLRGSCYLLNIYLKDKISSWSFEEKTKVAENLALMTDFIRNKSKKVSSPN